MADWVKGVHLLSSLRDDPLRREAKGFTEPLYQKNSLNSGNATVQRHSGRQLFEDAGEKSIFTASGKHFYVQRKHISICGHILCVREKKSITHCK